jgi:hypothetical protein
MKILINIFYPFLWIFIVVQKWRGIRDARLGLVPQSKERVYWAAYVKQYEKQFSIVVIDLSNFKGE